MVCEDQYSKADGKYKKKIGYYMHTTLKDNMDFLLNNIKDDWDFVCIISGGGQVRVGKSVLAMQIARYWQSEVKKITGKEVPFDLENIFFNSEDLRKKAIDFPKFTPIIYDEAREALEAKKSMSKISQNIIDFFNECGQLNLFIILVIPDFFELKKPLAILRSRFLIDVYVRADIARKKYKRGNFRFFSFSRKRQLFIKGKRQYDNYFCVAPDFTGDWTNFYTLPEKKYRKYKLEALRIRARDAEKRLTPQQAKWKKQRDILLKWIGKNTSLNKTERGNLINLNRVSVMRAERNLEKSNFEKNAVRVSGTTYINKMNKGV